MIPLSRSSSFLRWVVLLAMVAGALATPIGGSAQVDSGATLTVLRGTVDVRQSSGAIVSSARSGLSLGVGDQISTQDGAGALVTFFDGSEVQLGSETSIVINEASRQGSRTNITIASIVGVTVHRVVTLTDSGSSYKVEAGGTVGLVRGTVFGHYIDPNGTVIVALQRCDVPPGAPAIRQTQCLEFPYEGNLVSVGTKVTYTPRGNLITERFRLSDSLFNVVTEFGDDEEGTENPGFNTGSRTVSQQTSSRTSVKDDATPVPTSDPCPAPIPGRTQLTQPAPAGSKELQVCSTVGFLVGDQVRINPGGSPSELGVVSGFGSILLSSGTTFGYGTGTGVQVDNFNLFATSTSTPTPDPTTTLTPAPSATPVPSSTATQTSTPTSTSTPTPTQTPVVVVSISAASPNPVTEPAYGATTTVSFTVSLSQVHNQAVNVQYDTTSAGATSPATGSPICPGAIDPNSDYVSVVNGIATIPANANPPTTTILITICGDYYVSDATEESFFVDISNPTGGAVLGTSRGTSTIREDSSGD